MKLLGRVLVQHDWCPNEKGTSDQGPTHPEGRPRKDTQGEPRTPKIAMHP